MNFKKTALASAVALIMGTGAAQASLVTITGATSSSNDNFTMLSGKTGCSPENTSPSCDGTGVTPTVGGTNDVAFTWDGKAYNAASDLGTANPSNMTLSSNTPFFGHFWTAHNIQAFAPGSYSFIYNNISTGLPTTFNMTVASGQLGAHMLFDWNGNNNINVFTVWNRSGGIFKGSDGTAMFTGTSNPAGNTANKVWDLVSIDTAMPDGPFAGSNANFNLMAPAAAPVPIPAAAWLFGSGLVGLVGVARRKRNSSV